MSILKTKFSAIIILLVVCTIANAQKDKSLIDKGLKSGQKGEYSKAIELFDQALAINPTSQSAMYNKGFAYEQLKNFKNAVIFYTKANAIKENWTTSYRKGLCHFQLRDYTSAITDYSRALRMSPENDKIIMSRANAYHMSGQYIEEIDDLNSHINRFPEDFKAKRSKGVALINAENYENAIVLFSELSSEVADAEKAQILDELAHAYFKHGDFSKAKSNIEKALVLDPNYVGLHITKAELQFELGNKEEACAAVKKARELGATSRNKRFSKIKLNCGR